MKTTQQKNDTLNIVFGGIGGQGVLLASEVCAWAAIYEGYHVKKSEVHGMAQRGGSVESHLRFGKLVWSPLVPTGKADYLVCFHSEEHDRLKPFLKKGGTDLLPALDEARRLLINPRYLNVFVLGVLSRSLPFRENNWVKAIKMVLSKRLFAENLEIFLKARRVER
ncbi:MAG: indolepyruvate oxidoreductase subunit beta [Candidatus Omnitrophica bacterium]|nr:indolepyruvate oxidoreductase subunit beta [Candidatus Omnitrophota bacterium]